MLIQTVKPYVAIARPDHWIKNIFMLAGTGVASVIYPQYMGWTVLGDVLIAFVATCLIASSNYVLNEILDSSRDSEHPEKRYRPIPMGLVSLPIAYAQWIGLGCVGLLMAVLVNKPFFLSGSVLWIMGIVYNVPPIRSKELPVIDVLSEAINNPIRFLLGWYAVSALPFPPSSMMIAYWMLGAFLMAAKRLAELREIGDSRVAAAYRSSFTWYTDNRLIITMMVYGTGFMFFFAVVMTKYHPELIISAPFLMILMGYLMKLAFEPHSILQQPEQLFQKPLFVTYALWCGALLYVLSLISIPDIRTFLGLEGRGW